MREAAPAAANLGFTARRMENEGAIGGRAVNFSYEAVGPG